MKVCFYTVIKIDRSVLKLQTCSSLTHTRFSVARLTTRTPLKGYSRLKSSLFLKTRIAKELTMKCWAQCCLGFNLTFLLLIHIFCAVHGPMYNVARHGWCAMKATG